MKASSLVFLLIPTILFGQSRHHFSHELQAQAKRYGPTVILNVYRRGLAIFLFIPGDFPPNTSLTQGTQLHVEPPSEVR